MTVLNPHQQTQKVEARMSSGFTEVVGYLQRKEDIDEALSHLRTKGLPGQLLSGEVCLEEASRNPEDGGYWIEKSIGYFSRAWRVEDTRVVTPYTPMATTAAIRLAQIDVLRPLLLGEGLPDARTVEQAQKETILIAAHIGSIMMRPNEYRKTKIKNDCFGILSEVAVLGLAQRFSVRNGVSDCWQATPALLGTDRGTVRRGAIRDNWDMDIWSKQDELLPELAYRVQVKSSDHLVKSYAKGITVVNVSPDLSVTGKDGNILGLKIVHELRTEQTARYTGRLPDILDRRTEKLLDAIER